MGFFGLFSSKGSGGSTSNSSSDDSYRDSDTLRDDVTNGILTQVSSGVYKDCDGNRFDSDYNPID